MRALIATSLGVLTTASLLLPLTGPASATTPQDRPPGGTASATLPGSTTSLPLTVPNPPDRARRAPRADHADAPREAVLARRIVEPFSLLGVVWDDPGQALDGTVQVRTRSAADGVWSSWQTLHNHTDHAPRTGGARHGATAPLWVGPSDGVQVRVHVPHGQLPHGLRVELVDPGDTPNRSAGPREPEHDGRRAKENRGRAPDQPFWLPELNRVETVVDAADRGLADRWAAGDPHIGPRPGIVTRSGWGADAGLREGGFVYGKEVRMAFVHHTAMSNNYKCSQAPSIIRGIYRYHVKSSGWRDIGYNFLVDKCGTIYEGRAGGVTEPVRGAHTLGFNVNTMGVAVLGSFGNHKPPRKATDAVAKLTAWKLGLYGVDAKDRTRMVSGGGKYAKGRKVTFHTISGHRDGFNTECPGEELYDRLPAIRNLAAKLQGR